MKYQYFISSPWRNRDKVLELTKKLRKRGKSIYCFMEDKKTLNINDDPQKVMKKFESIINWQKDKTVRKIFKADLNALKASREIIVLLPGGKSTHIEAGIAYGLGKKLTLIGEQKETESLYLIFSKTYSNISKFLKSLK